VRWIRRHRGITLLALGTVAVLLVGLSGGFATAEETARAVRSGDRLELTRWTVRLPGEAHVWRGSPYLEYEEVDPQVTVGALLRVTATGASSAYLPDGLVTASLRGRDGSWHILPEAEARMWLAQDGTWLERLQPRVPERVLVTWTVPQRFAKRRMRQLRLQIHDERLETGYGFPQWVLDPGRTRVALLDVRPAATPAAPAEAG
jgi:hypothetical protein